MCCDEVPSGPLLGPVPRHLRSARNETASEREREGERERERERDVRAETT